MMIKPFPLLLLLLSAVATHAFVVPVPPTLRATAVLQDTTTTKNSSVRSENDALEELQHEYKVLQEKLLRDVVIVHDEEDAELIEEQMIEIAAKATKIHEEHQRKAIQEAENTRLAAQEVRERALDAFQEAVEHDAEPSIVYDKLVEYSDFRELTAAHKISACNILLKQLEANEKRLEHTLETLKTEYHKDEKQETASLEEEIHSQHRSFLDKVKDAIRAHPDILISLDPHIL